MCVLSLSLVRFVISDKAKLGKIPWSYIILDEGQRIKNQESKLALTLNSHYNSKHRLVLTGTPLQVCGCNHRRRFNIFLTIIFGLS